MSIEVEERAEAAYDAAELPDYRVLSSQAVASCVLGVLSAAVLLSYDYGLVLGIIPLLGLVLGARALWAIRSNPLEVTGQGLAVWGLALSLGFLVAGYSVAGYIYATEVPEGYRRIDYSLLQPEEDKPEAPPIPQSARDLDGQRVFIKGYVFPGQQTEGIKQFVLCRDNGDCCFGGQPKLTDRILVTLQDPLRLTYSTRLQRLAGTFRVSHAKAVDGLSDAVYMLEADHLAQ